MGKLIIGCGYLGRRVAALWQAQQHDVYAMTRRPAEAAALQARQLMPVLGDVTDPASLTQLPAVDTVVYAVGFDRAAGHSMRAVYVDGLANVLACLPPPARFIYVSSTSVYGQTDGGWVDEDAATDPLEESGKIVLAAEAVLRDRLPAAVLLRFAGIYGPGRLLRQATIERGEPIIGAADKWLNLIQVEDGARAVLAAEAHAEPGGVFNVCDDEPITRRVFYTELARQLHAPAPQFVAPSANVVLSHELANRRIRNTRMKQHLQVALRYPNHQLGLAASLAKPSS